MCQITPFTLPCCRRIYVLAKKISTCPDQWPKLKCPPELCLQIGTHEPSSAEHRTEGTCWRCKAHWEGITGEEREKLRPAIDQAGLVEGLEETTSEERRRRVEASGKCWFCMGDASKRGCDMCGVETQTSRFSFTSMGPPPTRSRPSDRGEKRRPHVPNTPKKRTKMEDSYLYGSVGIVGEGPRYTGMSSPLRAHYQMTNERFADSSQQVPSQDPFTQPQNDGLPDTNIQKQYSPSQEYELYSESLISHSHTDGNAHFSPNCYLQHPQNDTNKPGGYSEVPYQSQNRNKINTRLPNVRGYEPRSNLNMPRSNILNPLSIQSRRPISNPPSPHNPVSWHLEQGQSQSGNQTEGGTCEMQDGEWNPLDFDPWSIDNQYPKAESQNQPLARDFAEVAASGYTIDPQLMSFSHGLEDSFLHTYTPTSADFESQSGIESTTQTRGTGCHNTQARTVASHIQCAVLDEQAKGRSISNVAKVEADGKNTNLVTKTHTNSEMTQSPVNLQSTEVEGDYFSQGLFGESELSRILDEFDNIPSTY